MSIYPTPLIKAGKSPLRLTLPPCVRVISEMSCLNVIITLQAERVIRPGKQLASDGQMPAGRTSAG